MSATAKSRSEIKRLNVGAGRPMMEGVESFGNWISEPQRRRLSINGGIGKRSRNVWITFQHKIDPKQVIFESIGEIPADTVQFSRLLVAIYQPPISDKSEGGVILPDQIKDNDLEEYWWQGKVGLIVSAGPQAYVDDEATKFHGTKNSIGDWVWFRPSDGMACEVNTVFCRIFYERDIIGKLPHPDSIW